MSGQRGFQVGAPPRFTSWVIFGALSPGSLGQRMWYPPMAGNNASALGSAQVWTAPKPGALLNAQFYNSAPGGATAFSLEYYLNGVATGLVLSVTSATVGLVPFPCPPSVVAGDTVEVRNVAGGGAVQCGPRIHIEFWEAP